MTLTYILLSVLTATAAASKEQGQLLFLFNVEVCVLMFPLPKAGMNFTVL